MTAVVKVWLLCGACCDQCEGVITHRCEGVIVVLGWLCTDSCDHCCDVVIVMCAGYLYHLTLKIVDSLNIEELRTKKQDLLKQLTKPLTKRIVQVSCGQNTQCLKSCSL